MDALFRTNRLPRLPRRFRASGRRAVVVTLTALAAVAIVSRGLATAGPDAGRPLITLSFEGVDEVGDAFAATGLGQMLADPGIAPMVEQIPAAILAAMRADAPAEANFAGIETVAATIREIARSPWSLRVFPPTLPGGPPVAVLTARPGGTGGEAAVRVRDALVGAADDAPVASVDLHGAEAFRIGTEEAPQAWFGGQGAELVVATTAAAFVSAPSLGDGAAHDQGAIDALFTDADTGVRAGRMAIDLAALIDLAKAAAAADGDEEFARAVDAFGFDAFEAIAVEIGFDGDQIRGWSRVGIDTDRDTGARWLELLAGPPLTAADLAPVPSNASSFSVSRLDPSVGWAFIRDAVEQLNPEGAEQLTAALAGIREQTGIDIEQDVIAALGDTFITWSSSGVPNPFGGGMGESALLWSVRDENALATAIDTACGIAAAALEAQQSDSTGGFQFRVQSSELEGRKVWYLAGMPMLAPAVCVGNGYLVTSLQPNGCRAEAERLSAPGPSAISEPTIAARWAELDGRAMSFQYENLATTVPSLYQGVLAMAPMMAASKGVNLDLSKLPTASAVARYLGPGFAWHTADDKGIVGEWSSPVGLAGIGSPSGPAVIGIGAGVLLPALSNARSTARATVAMSGLHQVGVALLLYANDHDDRFPAAIDDLTPVYLSEDRLLENPEGQPFLYLTPGLRPGDVDAPEELAVVMESAPRRKGSSEGRNVLFADGHVEWILETEIPSLWGADAKDAPEKEPEL